MAQQLDTWVCSDSSDSDEAREEPDSPSGICKQDPTSCSDYMACGDGYGDGCVGEIDKGCSSNVRTTNRGKRKRTGVQKKRDDVDESTCANDANLLQFDMHDGVSVASSEAADTAVAVRERCWLCTFCTHSKAVQLSLFIEEHAAHMVIDLTFIDLT